MFDTLQDRLAATFKNLRGKGRLSDADIDATCREIRIALLEADVNLSVVKEFIANVKMRAKGSELSQALNPTQQIIKIVNEELIRVLGGQTRELRLAKQPPTVIMLAGLQGAGKTTLAGKLGRWLRGRGLAPLLVAADLQRPNAVNQLQVVGDRAGVHVYAPQPGNGVGDPVQVARESIEYARQKLYNVVIVDTAGRLGIDEELMRQAADIKAAVNPTEVLFVVDAMIGQDAVNTATAFQEGVGFDAVVLTKLDGDARGGAALSIARVVGKPIMFASNGEKLDDFDLFHPDRMASRILGMGDMLTLIEQAEKTFDAEQSRKAAEKLLGGKGEFTLADFLQQMQAVRKMGSMSKIMGMLPGMGDMKEQINNIDEREIDRIEAIIKSMTPGERDEPKIIDGSRRRRIANGSGTSVQEVNALVDRFFEARKMMSSLGAGMAGMAKKAAKQQQGKKKAGRKVSGNPAKRAAALSAAPGAEQPEGTAPMDPGAALGFGRGQAPTEADLAQLMEGGGPQGFDLPPQLRDMLKQQNRGPQH